MASKRRDKSIKAAEIFKAASKVFVRRGLDGATIQEIAKEAGVGRATVYYHFPSKKVILKEILISNLEKFFKDFLNYSKKIKKEEDIPDYLVRYFINFYKKDPLFAQLYFLSFASSRTFWIKDIIKDFLDVHNKWLEIIEKELKKKFAISVHSLALPVTFAHGLGLLYLSSKNFDLINNVGNAFLSIQKKAKIKPKKK
ncbi:MAG: TetR/AcrR family transcriptional regulator [Acidobacteriota bacterium]